MKAKIISRFYFVESSTYLHVRMLKGAFFKSLRIRFLKWQRKGLCGSKMKKNLRIMFPTLNEATAPMTYISKKEPISSHPHLYKSIMQSHDASLIENSNLFHPTLMCSVVSTNKRSQAEVFKVYFSLKYLECNNYNVHFTLTSLCPTNVCRCISPLPPHWPAGT